MHAFATGYVGAIYVSIVPRQTQSHSDALEPDFMIFPAAAMPWYIFASSILPIISPPLSFTHLFKCFDSSTTHLSARSTQVFCLSTRVARQPLLTAEIRKGRGRGEEGREVTGERDIEGI